MWQVFRNENDADLDFEKKPVPQRRHGDASLFAGVNVYYNKPVLAKTGLPIKFGLGNHDIAFSQTLDFKTRVKTALKMLKKEYTLPPVKIAPLALQGAHWAWADPIIVQERMVKNRQKRQSQNNLKKGYNFHYKISEDEIKTKLKAHLKDPRLF